MVSGGGSSEVNSFAVFVGVLAGVVILLFLSYYIGSYITKKLYKSKNQVVSNETPVVVVKQVE